MCRNITGLRGLGPPATGAETAAAARQDVRKVSGVTRPTAPRRSAGAVTTQTATTAALKEWSAAVHALLDGRQTVLLRKGGIHEKRFDVAAEEFLLFPTVAHSHAARVRPEHRDLLTAAAADSTDDRVIIRAAAKVVAAVTVNRPERIGEIEGLHIWTADSVREDRLDFRPKHRLTVLVVQVRPLVSPVSVIRTPQYAGCTSWVQLPVVAPLAAPVHDDAVLHRVAERVRGALR